MKKYVQKTAIDILLVFKKKKQENGYLIVAKWNITYQ